jgi:enoyl-[acyl-carrier-protein] reductase (NADH)
MSGRVNMFSLAEKVGLVVGIADEQSIAWGCANAFHDAGAELAVTYLMTQGGACLTVSYRGSERAVAYYGIMGPVKTAPEAAVRYAAVEPGPEGITVNALSPGPPRTRAASGIAHFGGVQ